MNEKKNEVNVGVFIPARNEEKIIFNTIQALLRQKLKPKKIIVVNDGSHDKTHTIAISLGCEVIDLSFDGIEGLDNVKMSNVYNIGLNKLNEGFDYILELGADHILPQNYISDIVQEMENNKKLAIASGIIENEEHDNEIPRGSGRIIKSSFYKKIGMNWPKKLGAESFFVYEALRLGYQTKVFQINTQARKTGTHYNSNTFVNLGKASKALGYFSLYAFGAFLKKALFYKNIKVLIYCLQGWFSSDVEKYNKELREFVKEYQKKKIIRIIKRRSN